MLPPDQPLRITVLGSGTSVGIPMVGCRCPVCLSSDPRDSRSRPSVLLQYAGRNVVIDTTPDFRVQALRAGIDHLDAVLFTHAHADHILGLDDVRPLNLVPNRSIPIFGSPETIAAVKRCFAYIFDGTEKESWIPRLEVITLDGSPFDLFGLRITPIPVLHGKAMIFGFRFGDAAYLTDHSDIPAESMQMLRGLDVLFLDALRHKPHPTHSTIERALGHVRDLSPARAYFTHICHDLPHEATQAALPSNVRLAYDTLEITVGGDR
ncbi:MAG: MBL fold metallo-hydrolase [Bryobacteraceae bacterium]